MTDEPDNEEKRRQFEATVNQTLQPSIPRKIFKDWWAHIEKFMKKDNPSLWEKIKDLSKDEKIRVLSNTPFSLERYEEAQRRAADALVRAMDKVDQIRKQRRLERKREAAHVQDNKADGPATE